MSSNKSAAPTAIKVPEGFAIGTMPDNQQYVMPHFMVPGYKYSLLVDTISSSVHTPAASPLAQEESPYIEGQGPYMDIPDDAVSVTFIGFHISH